MSTHTGFVSKYVDKIYSKVNEHFEFDPRLENTLRASIAVDLLIYYIEQLNGLPIDKSKSRSLIDSLSDASINLFSETSHYKAIDFASSREEAAAILTEIALDGVSGTPDELANTNFGLRTLTGRLYNVRVKKYFSDNSPPVMVVSSAVPILVKNLGLEDTDFSFIQEINSIFMESSLDLVNIVNGKSINTSSSTKNDNCYIVTAASGSADSELVHFYRNFRDDVLNNSYFGKRFIKSYYKFSPKFAEFVRRNYMLRALSLFVLKSLRRAIEIFRGHSNDI